MRSSVTEGGTSREAGSPEQFWKAHSPTEATVAGSETEESKEQPEKSPGATAREPSASVAERREEPSKGPEIL